MAKPSAASRTVDMFSVLTKEQADKQEAAEAASAAAEDAKEAPKQAETIEQAAERWRNNAFFTQEHMSKSWGNAIEKGVFRLTERNGWLFLEQYRNGRDGMAFHWAGVMFPTTDLYELTNVFVKASKAMKERENGSH